MDYLGKVADWMKTPGTADSGNAHPAFANAIAVDEEYEDDDEEDKEEEDDSESHELELAPNVYSDIILTCARRQPLEIFSSALILILNLVIQLCFASIMGPVLAKNDFYDVIRAESEWGEVNLLKDWRYSASGGEACRYNTQQVWWACTQKDWSWQASELEDLEEYADPVMEGYLDMYKGTFFGAIAIFSWIGVQFKEVKEVFAYCRLLRLPNSDDNLPDYIYNKELGGRLNSLCMPVKIVIVLVSIARLVICGYLTIYGAQFLIHTIGLQDFILNCVALVFVYEFDELFFDIFINRHKRRRVKTLQPIQIPRSAWGKQVMSGDCMTMIMELAGLFFAMGLTGYYVGSLREFGNAVGVTIGSVCPTWIDDFQDQFHCGTGTVTPDPNWLDDNHYFPPVP
mmetsp:Transcript_67257/g.122663  ORF Transcript_67257/g.122663 Transcript_67257/m.122663 type:complete len:399 (-) Transcript_67257:80-1276(-)